MIPATAMEKKKKAVSSPDFDPGRGDPPAGAAPVGEEQRDAEDAGGDEQPVRLAEARHRVEGAPLGLRQPFPPGDRVEVDGEQEQDDERQRQRRSADHQAPRAGRLALHAFGTRTRRRRLRNTPTIAGNGEAPLPRLHVGQIASGSGRGVF